MSSVTRFIRQIQPDTAYYSAATVAAAVAGGATNAVFELVPAAGNVVGNYPPGTMTSASTGLATAIAAQIAGAGGAANVVLRDMGKTVRTNVTGTSNIGFFRQVQLIAPAAITSYIGGVGGSNFGVLGNINVPDANTDYVTFYVPIVALGASTNVANISSHTMFQQ
uniref:Uncharacterized protein n=1 Tax=viral metagenome TaxID=1070528 RepID=A0A6C0KVQ2_9ZZZZ